MRICSLVVCVALKCSILAGGAMLAGEAWSMDARREISGAGSSSDARSIVSEREGRRTERQSTPYAGAPSSGTLEEESATSSRAITSASEEEQAIEAAAEKFEAFQQRAIENPALFIAMDEDGSSQKFLKDLLFLLAEEALRQGIPFPEDYKLCADSLCFVSGNFPSAIEIITRANERVALEARGFWGASGTDAGGG